MQEKRVETFSAETQPLVPVAAASNVDSTVMQASVRDTAAERSNLLRRIEQIAYVVLAIVEIGLGARFILGLFGANPDAGFATFVYGVSDPLVAPFRGLFAEPAAAGSVLDPNTLVAMVIYALLTVLLTRLMWIIFAPSNRTVVTSSGTTHFRS